METIEIDDALITIVNKAIIVALEYGTSTQGARKLGITGEVGEILVCKKLGLRLMADSLSEGYDAIDKDGKLVQIKTRRGESGEKPKETGRLGKFSEHEFDYALLGILDSSYKLVEIWRADNELIEPIILKQKRRNPSLSSFKRVARRVFPL
jgi:hypothetical protein